MIPAALQIIVSDAVAFVVPSYQMLTISAPLTLVLTDQVANARAECGAYRCRENLSSSKSACRATDNAACNFRVALHRLAKTTHVLTSGGHHSSCQHTR